MTAREFARVTFVLDNISAVVGEEVIIGDVSLTLERGTMNVLLGPTLCRQDAR